MPRTVAALILPAGMTGAGADGARIAAEPSGTTLPVSRKAGGARWIVHDASF